MLRDYRKGIKYQPFLLDIIIRIKSLPTTRFFTRVFLDYSEDPRSELSRTYVWKSEFRPSKILAPFQFQVTRKGAIGRETNYNMKNLIGFSLPVKCAVIVNIK